MDIPLIKDLKFIVIEYIGTDLELDFNIDLWYIKNPIS